MLIANSKIYTNELGAGQNIEQDHRCRYESCNCTANQSQANIYITARYNLLVHQNIDAIFISLEQAL